MMGAGIAVMNGAEQEPAADRPKRAASPEPTPTPACGPQWTSARLKDLSTDGAERNWGVAMHLSPFAAMLVGPLIIAPLVIWLVRKGESSFNDDHGREVVNMGLSYLLIGFLLSWTVIVPIVLLVVAAINMIRGAIAASNGEYFRYPMTIRFIS